MKKLHFLFIFILLLSFNLLAENKTLKVTLVKNNVTLDWSEMQNADSYDLYYALGKLDGTPDLSTLGFINMKDKKTISINGLPSGFNIYVAVLAHLGSSNIVSNIEKFIPMNVTADFETSNDIFLTVKENQNKNKFDLIGNKNIDGEYVISEIRSLYNNNNYIIKLDEERVTRIYSGNNALIFNYDNNGKLISVDFRNILKSNLKFMLSTKTEDVCSDDDMIFEEIMKDETLAESWREGYKKIKVMYNTFLAGMSIIGMSIGEKIKELELYEFANRSKIRRYKNKEKLFEEFSLSLVEMHNMAIKDLKEKMIEEYKKENCTVIDMSCPVPDGAKLVELNNIKYYELNNKYVGPYFLWSTINEKPFLVLQKCYNSEGVLNGWTGSYFTNGRSVYTHYVLGVKDMEYAYLGDILVAEIKWSGDTIIYSAMYDDNGNLTMVCNVDGCTKY